MKEQFFRYIKIFVISFCWVLFFHGATAQQSVQIPDLKFEQVGAAQGFHQLLQPSNIIQDKSGFIWFGAEDGLCRYDGYEFRYYAHDPNDKNSLKNATVRCLLASDDSIVWIGTEGGLCYYDPKKEMISVFKPVDKQGKFLSGSIIVSMAEDHQNNLWVDADEKIVKVNLKTHEVDSFMHIDGQGFPFVDRAGNIWIGTDSKGLFYFDHLTYKLTVYNHDPKNKFSICSDNIFQVAEDLTGKIWVATTDNLCRFDTATKQFTTYKYDPKDPSSLGNFFVNGGVYVDHEGTVWASTYGGGLDRFDPATESFIRYKTDANDQQSIGANSIRGVFEDNGGMLWVNTDGAGLEKCWLKQEKFSVYNNFDPEPKTNYIADLYTDRNGIIWIGTQGGGTYSFDPVTKKIRSWLRNPKDNTLPLWYILPAGYYDDGKNIYIISVYEGITLLNRSSGKGTVLNSNYFIPNKIKDYTNYFTITADNSGRLWIGGQRGIMIYDTSIKKLKAFNEVYRDTNNLSSDVIGNLFTDEKGFIWAGGTTNGISCIDPVTGKVKIYQHRESDSTSVSSNSVFQFAEDNKNLLWISSDGSGLSVFDRNTGVFRAFTMRDGLPSNYIAGFMFDNCNNIWIINSSGISRCSYNQNESPFTVKLTVRNYDFGVNAGSNSEPQIACTKGKDGTLYFATQSGMIAFHPDSLKDNPFIPPVVITAFSLFNKRVIPSDTSALLKNSITFTKELILSYKENVIGFTFAALSYVHPEKNQYAYKLDGFDKDWIYTDATKRFANYTNLDPGEYTFEVKGSNNDGVWNETPTKLRLIITPPYWQTLWFKVLVGAILAMALYGMYRHRLQQVIKLQMIRNNIASDLHDDIGSTLNSISVFSEVAKQQAKENIPALEQIGISSRKIIESMSDIVWTINPENDNFEKIISRMRSLAYLFLKARKIEFMFEADESLNSVSLPMQVRKNFYLIFKEATNNIVKYSNATRASFNITHSGRQIRLEIRDNGVGFNLEEVKQGNGIKNMKRRAEEIKAHLSIESAPERGTMIELTLKT